MDMDVDSNAFDNNNEDDNTTVENSSTPTTPTPSLSKEGIRIKMMIITKKMLIMIQVIY